MSTTTTDANKDKSTPAKKSTTEKSKNKAKPSLAHSTSLNLPLARVKRIIKSDPEVRLISNDCSVMIAKSTELLIDMLVKEAFNNSQGKKTLKYDDLVINITIARLINERDDLLFLRDLIPERKALFPES